MYGIPANTRIFVTFWTSLSYDFLPTHILKITTIIINVIIICHLLIWLKWDTGWDMFWFLYFTFGHFIRYTCIVATFIVDLKQTKQLRLHRNVKKLKISYNTWLYSIWCFAQVSVCFLSIRVITKEPLLALDITLSTEWSECKSGTKCISWSRDADSFIHCVHKLATLLDTPTPAQLKDYGSCFFPCRICAHCVALNQCTRPLLTAYAATFDTLVTHYHVSVSDSPWEWFIAQKISGQDIFPWWSLPTAG